MSIAPINGIKIYYEKFGNGSPIIFIHGAYGGIDSSVTPRKNDWVDKLKGSHTVITYDRRSAGRSSYPDEVHSIDILASDLSELINYLELKNHRVSCDHPHHYKLGYFLIKHFLI